MNSVPARTLCPDAVICLDQPYHDAGGSGPTLYFFKNFQFACWDVVSESMRPGYPREIAPHWPGLLESFPGKPLRGAIHVPAWGDSALFFFEGETDALCYGLPPGSGAIRRIPVRELLPSRLTQESFTPVYAQLADGTPVVYAFREREYTRWTVAPQWSAREDAGYPRVIAEDWKDGLVLAPRAGVYVDWPSRSSAHSNRKIYYFMGDLYLRWDVPSNTRNYRLDIVAGWKGWTSFR
jgi:hypothetical protein